VIHFASHSRHLVGDPFKGKYTVETMDYFLSLLSSGASAIIPFIILLGLLIFVHELGHFLVAKYFGVKVEVFSLGFGKKIFSHKRGDTVYCISLIPLGGYVKMFGDELGAQLSEEEKKVSFTHKPVGQRIAVVLAGPLMNFFFAIFVFFVIALIGEDAKAPKVGDIAESTVAYQAGFRSGDTLLSVNSNAVKTWDDFQHLISQKHGQPLNIEVRRANSDQLEVVSATPTLTPNPNILSLDAFVGDISGLSSQARASVIGVLPNSIARKYGFQTGDLVTEINGVAVKYFREIENLIVSFAGNEMKVKVHRFKDLRDESFEVVNLSFEKPQVSSLAALGIVNSELFLADVVKDSPASKAGLMSGDRIVQVNSKTPTQWEDVLNEVKSYSGQGEISVRVLRESGEVELKLIPQMTSQLTAQGSEEKRFTIGIRPWILNALPESVSIKSEGLGSAFVRGVERTGEVTAMTVVSFLRLIQGMISPKTIGGVISIGQVASESFKMGISQFLTIMGFISINLFILNLLPIPVLDGGHLLFYSIEALRGAPVSMRKMEIAQQIGLVMLMSLMAFALFNDFTRLFGQ
jgi:regulator of sigma E protease